MLETTAPPKPATQSPVKPVTATKSDVLLRAAAIMDEFDWLRCDWGSRKDGALCASKAIDEALADFGRPFHWSEMWNAFADTHNRNPMGFNDSVAKNKAEVVAALREAAEQAA